jgi:uncharacterized protein
MPTSSDSLVYQLLFNMICAIVDHPNGVVIKTVWVDGGATFAVSAHPDDIGQIIGKQGRNARALRTIVNATGMKLKRRFVIMIDEEPEEAVDPRDSD